jgi:6-phosphofructokinase
VVGADLTPGMALAINGVIRSVIKELNAVVVALIAV